MEINFIDAINGCDSEILLNKRVFAINVEGEELTCRNSQEDAMNVEEEEVLLEIMG